MKITCTKRNVRGSHRAAGRKIVAFNTLESKRNAAKPYAYVTKHGIGPGTLPRDVNLVDCEDLDDYLTLIYVDRPLSSKELDAYEIYPETRTNAILKQYGKRIGAATRNVRKYSVKAAVDNTVSQDDVNELVLYIVNDGVLYKQVQQIVKNMSRKVKNGVYDSTAAVKAWMYLADAGVKKYDKEFGSGRGSLTFLNKATRTAIAEELSEYYYDYYDGYADEDVTSASDTKTYEITYDRFQDTVTVDSFENEQDAVDKLIDQLEAEGSTGCFVDPDEYNEDEYVIGGNHGLALYTGGNFRIVEIDGGVESATRNVRKFTVMASEYDEDLIDALWNACDDISGLMTIDYANDDSGILFIYEDTTPDYESREEELISTLKYHGYSAEYVANNGSNVIELQITK